jgi:SPP1 gp7 family putative phage head morphogenesis protein
MEIMAERIRSTPETIARTEVIGAANGGTLEAWRQSGVVQRKTWLAALDARTRDSHVEAHGQTVALEADFVVGGHLGPAPGQIGEPDEDINCRCSMTAKV